MAVLRHGRRLAGTAGGNDVSESTVRRWRDELIALLAVVVVGDQLLPGSAAWSRLRRRDPLL